MSNFRLKIVDRRTRKVRVLTLEEFKREFSKELINAVNIYTTHANSRNFLPPFMDHRDYKQEFYDSLQFNFNNYACTCCSWYIERIF